jgi:hypothetical protein
MITTPNIFFDPPVLLDASVTPIPGSASLPLQVIANLGNVTCNAMFFIDTTGVFIGVYTGPAGSEQLACVIGNGLIGMAKGLFPAGARVSLRSLTTSAITSGKVGGNLQI